MKFSRNLFAIVLLLSFNSIFSQTDDGEEDTSNRSFVSRTFGDHDHDGVLDDSDQDNDNDGIIDSFECSVSIQFDSPSLLTATDLDDIQVGEKVVYSNALLFQNQYYDIILTLTGISGTVTVDVNTELEVIGFNPNVDEYVTYSFDLVESGSATIGNPSGIPVSLNNIIIGLQDIDHRSGKDYTEISGYNTLTMTSSINGYLNTTTNLEAGGFINGGAPANFSLFRLNPAISGSATDWIDEPNDSSPFTPEFTVYMKFDVFSHVDLIFGVTGTESSVGLRHTHFTADSNCDDDNDNVDNKLDIDADNDGIPDNVEAQPTNLYILPSVTVDPVTGIPTVYGSGLIPEDTDNDNTPDFTDFDSDNDGTPDIQENGMADAIVSSADDDADGLDNIFETNGVNDLTIDVNEDIEDPTDLSILPDTDSDLAMGGDLDYRDAIDVFIESASVDFDGIDDHIAETSFMGGWPDATIMAWIKLDPTFISNGDVAGQSHMRIYVDGTTKKLHSYYITSMGSSAYGSSSTITLDTDQWYHVAISYKGTSGMTKLYVNGELEQSGSIPAGTLSTNPIYAHPDFNIGRHSRLDNSYFKGAIDEVRVFNAVLTDSQLQQMVYQEIEQDGANIKGAIMNKNITDIATNTALPWANLQAYYPMTKILTGKTTDASGYGRDADLKNIITVQPQTAPMPYETVSDGTWTTEGTWLHGDVWDIEDVANNKDWSIVSIKNHITTSDSHSQLGLMIDTGRTLTVSGDNAITNNWLLQLDGTLDLADDSQLIQSRNSDLVTSATGKILRRQEGNNDFYWYNYWSSPVGITGATALSDNNRTSNNTNNSPFNIDMLMDGIGTTAMQFTSAYDEVGKISDRWLYTFQNGITYYDWVTLAPGSDIQPGVGYTQKGTGNAGTEQQYTFVGKPNNGTILIPATDVPDAGNESEQDVTLTTTLIGNPYPSALDARQFISDNAGVIQGTILLWEQWAGTSHWLAEYEGGYGFINNFATERAYQYPGIPIADQVQTQGIKIPTYYLPVGQGFFVEIVNNGDIEFNNGQRVFIKESDADGVDPNSGSSFFRDGNEPVTEESSTENRVDEMQILRLEFGVSNGASRSFVLGFSDFTTDGFDYGYDGGLITNPPADDMGSSFNGEQYVIQAFAPITPEKEVNLVMHSSGNFTHTLKSTEITNIPESQPLLIRDNLTGSIYDLRSTEPYNFTSESGTFTNRFKVIFTNPTLSVNDAILDTLLIFMDNGQDMLIVKGLDQNVKSMSLTNMLGQAVRTFNNIEKNTLNNGVYIGDLSSGVYLVNLITEDNLKLNKKIILE